MKRFLSILLIMVLLLCGCAVKRDENAAPAVKEEKEVGTSLNKDASDPKKEDDSEQSEEAKDEKTKTWKAM